MKKGTLALFSLFCCLCLSLGLYLTLSVSSENTITPDASNTIEDQTVAATFTFRVRIATRYYTSYSGYTQTKPSPTESGYNGGYANANSSSGSMALFDFYWREDGSGNLKDFGQKASGNGALIDSSNTYARDLSGFYYYYPNGSGLFSVKRFGEIAIALHGDRTNDIYCGYVTTDNPGLNECWEQKTQESIYLYGNSITTDYATAKNQATYSIDAYINLIYRRKYNISFNANGGYNAPSSFSVLAGIGNGVSVNTPTRTGYDFKGWSTSSSSSEVAFYNSFPDNLADASRTFYAVWEPKSYTVTFEKQGGTGGTDSINVQYTNSYPDISIPSKTGYDFMGYCTGTGGTGTRYYDEAGHALITNHESPSDLTLYAWWRLSTYWLNINVLNPGGGEDSISAYFDLEISDTGGNYSGTYTNLTNEPSYDGLGYGSTIKIYNIRSYTDGKYALDNVTCTNGITNNGDGSYTFTVTSGDVIVIQMRWIEYYLDVNGLLDDVYSGKVAGYGIFSLKIDGNDKAVNENDYYNTALHYGQTYEVYNIRAETNCIYKGVAAGSLFGTLTGNVDISLKFDIDYWTYEASSSFAGGNGTQASPYLISSAEELAYLASLSQNSTLSGQYYKLISDLDLSAHVWKPIGNKGYHFAGNFEGGMHVIKKVRIGANKALLTDCQGLFGVTANATIQNVFLSQVVVSATNTAAALIGAIDSGGLVENCFVEDVDIATNAATAGGIVGANYSGTIRSCFASAIRIRSTGDAHFGGLVGYSQNGTLQDSNAIGCNLQLSGISRSGSLLGYDGGGTTIRACYAQTMLNDTNYKQFYGDASAWGNWTVADNINEAMPVQKPLFAVGGFSDSTTIYNTLKNLGFSEI